MNTVSWFRLNASSRSGMWKEEHSQFTVYATSSMISAMNNTNST